MKNSGRERSGRGIYEYVEGEHDRGVGGDVRQWRRGSEGCGILFPREEEAETRAKF